jgi:hypothetical protein
MCQGAVNWAFISDFQHPLALLGRQITLQFDAAFDTVAALPIDLDLVMCQFDRNLTQRNSFAFGVHTQGHGSAGTQSGEQEIKWSRAGIAAAHADGFIGDQFMLSGKDRLLVSSLPIFLDDDGA